MLKQKQTAKRRKLYKFNQLIRDFSYFKFKYWDTEGFKGWIYALDNPDKERLQSVIRDYDNTKTIESHYRYAPEIVVTWLFIAK